MRGSFLGSEFITSMRIPKCIKENAMEPIQVWLSYDYIIYGWLSNDLVNECISITQLFQLYAGPTYSRVHVLNNLNGTQDNMLLQECYED